MGIVINKYWNDVRYSGKVKNDRRMIGILGVNGGNKGNFGGGQRSRF